jgi:signal transduction histidine kinase
VAVPLLVTDQVIGALTVGDEIGRVFRPEEIELAQAFADQAAIALENARLYEELAARLDREQRLAAEVVAVARAREEFLLSVSHELGTPLTAIKAYVDTLRAEPALDLPTRQEFLAVLQAEVDRLARLIVNILDASKLEMGAFMLDLTTVDLAEVAACVARDAQMRRPITCEIAGPLAVRGDRDRLKQVLVNLVDNAIKFSPVDQPVRVRAGREGAQAVVRVSDRGPGIPDEQIGHLFRKFSRLSRSGRGAPPGSGLGLYLASEIVKEHAGTLAAEPHGSDLVFVVRIPLLGEPGAGKEEPS